MKRAYQISGFMLLGFAAFVAWHAADMRYYSRLGPGPGFFPVWLAALLGLLAVLMIAQATLGADARWPEGFWPRRAGVLRVAGVVAALLLLLVAFEPLGFRLTMLLFYLALFTALGGNSLVASAVFAVLASLGSHFLFAHLLKLPLPAGVLGF